MSQPIYNVYYKRLFTHKDKTDEALQEWTRQGWTIISSTLGDDYDNILLEKKEPNQYAGL